VEDVDCVVEDEDGGGGVGVDEKLGSCDVVADKDGGVDVEEELGSCDIVADEDGGGVGTDEELGSGNVVADEVLGTGVDDDTMVLVEDTGFSEVEVFWEAVGVSVDEEEGGEGPDVGGGLGADVFDVEGEVVSIEEVSVFAGVEVEIEEIVSAGVDDVESPKEVKMDEGEGVEPVETVDEIEDGVFGDEGEEAVMKEGRGVFYKEIL